MICWIPLRRMEVRRIHICCPYGESKIDPLPITIMTTYIRSNCCRGKKIFMPWDNLKIWKKIYLKLVSPSQWSLELFPVNCWLPHEKCFSLTFEILTSTSMIINHMGKSLIFTHKKWPTVTLVTSGFFFSFKCLCVIYSKKHSSQDWTPNAFLDTPPS